MSEMRGNVDESAAVVALRTLSVFSADQAGAYREHFADVAGVLGSDVETKLSRFLSGWAREGNPGLVVLTGNAGTGKTAAAEAYCRALGQALPIEDALVELIPGRRVLKDLSGLPSTSARADAMRDALRDLTVGQTLVCANEGVLRDAFSEIQSKIGNESLDIALRHGAHSNDGLTIVNVNRQRLTGDSLWSALLDYVTREEIWLGCGGCPFNLGGCPMRSNAEQLRRSDVRGQLRTLFRLASGEAVPTIRELLAILAWAIVGTASCDHVKKRNRDLGIEAFTAFDGYFSRVVGGGMSSAVGERSPLLTAIRRAGLGSVSDLQVDGWLRDANGAPEGVKVIAGFPKGGGASGPKRSRLAGTRSPLDRIQTTQHEMTFYELGEMVSTDEDPTRVDDGLNALFRGDELTNTPAQSLWRQRIYFEAQSDLGGPARASRRLLNYGHIHDLFDLASTAASGGDTILELTEIVRGLNFLVTGFASADEGLIVSDTACLFARDPGSFRPASPSLVHAIVPIERLSIEVPDQGLVNELLDIDHIEVNLLVDNDHRLALRIQPRMYEAIREAAEYRGPVGQGVAEMNDLRGFYGQLAREFDPSPEMRIADPKANPPGLIKITLPRFAGPKGSH
jgi:hypothetical protein